jgi:hypothetical protein
MKILAAVLLLDSEAVCVSRLGYALALQKHLQAVKANGWIQGSGGGTNARTFSSSKVFKTYRPIWTRFGILAMDPFR